jgi:hypothetical protein
MTNTDGNGGENCVCLVSHILDTFLWLLALVMLRLAILDAGTIRQPIVEERRRLGRQRCLRDAGFTDSHILLPGNGFCETVAKLFR